MKTIKQEDATMNKERKTHLLFLDFTNNQPGIIIRSNWIDGNHEAPEWFGIKTEKTNGDLWVFKKGNVALSMGDPNTYYTYYREDFGAVSGDARIYSLDQWLEKVRNNKQKFTIADKEPECHCNSRHLATIGHETGCSYKSWKDSHKK